MTLYRRRKAEERDREALHLEQAEGGSQNRPGEPASSAAEPEPSRVDTLFSGGRGPEVPPPPKVPRTTAWNRLKVERIKEMGGEKERKPNKPRICQLCGQPRQNDYGHSQFGGEHFCALHSGITVELWLAEKRRT